MKTSTLSTLVVLFSLAGNAVLGFAVLQRKSGSASAISNPQTQTSSTKVAGNNPTATVASSLHASQQPGQRSKKLWESLNSTDLATLVANLRKAGFSPTLIRAIVQDLVYEKYHPHLQEAEGYSKDTPYWQSNEGYSYDSPKGRNIRRLYREIEREARSALGSDYFTVDGEALPYLQRQYGNIPVEKLAKLTDIQQDYEELQANISAGSATLPSDKEKLKLLEKEQRADIEKLLSPEELFEYDLRNGSASARLRGWDQTFDMTEAEYRALFPLYQAMEKQFPSDSPEDKQRSRKEAEAKMQDQIKTILGDARYAEFKQSQNPEARQENRLVVRLGLPLATATQLLEAKNDLRSQAKTIAKNKELTDDQKKEQLISLAKTAEGRVINLIGERGLAVYRDYGGGWLRPIPDSVSTPTAKTAP